MSHCRHSCLLPPTRTEQLMENILNHFFPSNISDYLHTKWDPESRRELYEKSDLLGMSSFLPECDVVDDIEQFQSRIWYFFSLCAIESLSVRQMRSMTQTYLKKSAL